MQVLSLQPVAIVDHVCMIEEDALKQLVADELGGSHRVELDEVQRTLTAVGEYYSKAGGSAANTTRGLAGLGISSKLIGARGFDEVRLHSRRVPPFVGKDIALLSAGDLCPT